MNSNPNAPLPTSPSGIWHRFSAPFLPGQFDPHSLPPWQPSHSYTSNWVQILEFMMGLGGNTWTTTTEPPADFVWDITQMDVEAPASNVDFGIVLGDGGPIVSLGSFHLNNQIVESTGLARLSHGACEIASTFSSAEQFGFLISRQFTSTGLDPANINEQGIYVSDGVNAFAMILDNIGQPFTLTTPFAALAQYFIATQLVVP